MLRAIPPSSTIAVQIFFFIVEYPMPDSEPMPRFYHMVLIRFTEPVGDSFFEELQVLVNKIRGAVPGLLFYHFGPNASDRGKGYTHCNLSVFDSSEAHDRYQSHPLHHEMRALMVPRMEFVVCDLDLNEDALAPPLSAL